MSPTTPCAQLVYTSAGRTLEGAGFGVVLTSRDWPAALGDTRSSLGSLVGFERECFGLLHRAGGRLAYSKVPADSDAFGRPGNYVVHLLWDKAGRLTPRDVLALRRSGGFLASLPAEFEPSAEADAVPVPTARRSLPAFSADDVDALTPHVATLLAALSVGSGVVHVPARTASAVDVAQVVAQVLPRGLVGGIGLHVGAGQRMGDTAAVSLVVGAPGRSDVEPDGHDLGRAHALLESAAKGELCPDSVRRLADLDRWLFVDTWMGLDPAMLTDDQLVGVLGSDGAGRWLESPPNAEVATAVAASSAEVEAALLAALERNPEAGDRLRDRELTAALEAIFDGADSVPAGYAGLTQGDVCEAFTASLARGRRVAAIGPGTALFVEESLNLGHPLALLELGDDHAGLARLATKRPVVRKALVREWAACEGAAGACTSVLGHLLLEDTDWVTTLGGGTPEPVVRSALTWASKRLAAERVEELAVTVASGDLAGQGWALGDVLFVCELPDDEVARMIGDNFELLARDAGWPRELAKLMAARLLDVPEPAGNGAGRHRWSRRRH